MATREAERAPARAEALPPPGVGLSEATFSKNRFVSILSSYSPPPSPSPVQRLYRNSVHGSRTSPRTDNGMLKINHLAVRPERVEGRMANYDTVSQGGGEVEEAYSNSKKETRNSGKIINSFFELFPAFMAS